MNELKFCEYGIISSFWRSTLRSVKLWRSEPERKYHTQERQYYLDTQEGEESKRVTLQRVSQEKDLYKESSYVQRRVTKMLLELKELSYIGRLQKLVLPTLVYRRIRGNMIEAESLNIEALLLPRHVEFWTSGAPSDRRYFSDKLKLSGCPHVIVYMCAHGWNELLVLYVTWSYTLLLINTLIVQAWYRKGVCSVGLLLAQPSQQWLDQVTVVLSIHNSPQLIISRT